jgi:ferredoxin
MRYIDRDGFVALLALLREGGYTLIGPTVRDDAIVLEEIEGADELPRGIREEQEAGWYRLKDSEDGHLFRWAHGPDSGKRFLFPPRESIQSGHRDSGVVTIEPAPLPEVRYAFVGLRACDLAAMEIQDRVFMVADPFYRARRDNSLTIGINCELPGTTCFCTSMGTGPRCTLGFDIALTELDHGFTAETATPRGDEVLDQIDARDATEAEAAASQSVTAEANLRMASLVDTDDLPALLVRNRENPRWDHVADRCLTCASCTMVCPTCFCHDISEQVSLDGTRSERTREWASCFGQDFTHMSFGDVRMSARSRYRQWLTHKFSSWVDQFGTSGCVGCGRCITWCPVGIDVTFELAAIRSTDGEERKHHDLGIGEEVRV